MKTTIIFLFCTVISFSQCLTSIGSGYNHAAGMKADGTLYTWGNGTFGWGALGNGIALDNVIPTQVTTMTNVQKIFVGSLNTFAIKNNGTLWGTGGNTQGQLGIGSSGVGNVSSTFIPIGTATNWKEISANFLHTIGLRTNGTLWAWGNNEYGSLGDGTAINRNVPTQIGTATNWKTVATCDSTSFGIKTDGSLWGWGYNGGLLGILVFEVNFSYAPIQIGNLGVYETDWDKITGGPNNMHVLALKNSGALYSWGSTWGTYEALGRSGNSALPAQIGADTDWVYIACGFDTSFAIKSNGTLWGWGKNDKGQLGDGTQITRSVPTQIGTDTDWVSVSAGYAHSVGLKSNGAVYTWGDDSLEQQGNGFGGGGYLSPVALNIPGCNLSQTEFYNEEAGMTIMPNPATAKTVIQFDAKSIPTIELYDLEGGLIRLFEQKENKGEFEFSLDGISVGTYLIVLKEKGIVTMQKKLLVK